MNHETRKTEPKITSEAFTRDLRPQLEEVRNTSTEGKLRRFARAFEKVFRPGLHKFRESDDALVLADRQQREMMAERQMAMENEERGRVVLPTEAGKMTMREMHLDNLYHQEDGGGDVSPDEIAHFEHLVREERDPKPEVREPNPFDPDTIDPASADEHGELVNHK